MKILNVVLRRYVAPFMLGACMAALAAIGEPALIAVPLVVASLWLLSTALRTPIAPGS